MALYAVVVKNIFVDFLRDKSRNYCRKVSGACHGYDIGLVDEGKSLFWA